MAPKVEASKNLAGIVKTVPSGDTLIIMENTKWGAREKTITLASIMAPRLARRGVGEEPFAWASREYLRKLCIGKNVRFRVDYTVPSIAREFGTVFLGDKNLAHLVVSQGFAKVKGLGQNKGEASPFWEDLKRAEEQAKLQKLGCWSDEREEAIRDLPPSAMGDASNFDAMGLIASHKGSPLEAIVEYVRDGSTLRVYLLPGFENVQVSVAGVQAPSTRLKSEEGYVFKSQKSSNEASVKAPTGSQAPTTAAEKLVATSSTYVPEGLPNPIGLEAKHFTEIRVLNRDVRIVPEGVDKFNNLIGSVYYSEGEVVKDLAMDLVQNGFAKCAEWSANYLEGDAKNKLKSAVVQAQRQQIKMWKGVVSESKAIHDQNFTGKVIEVPTGDCIVVADGLVERRIYLSSIKAPKMGNSRSEDPKLPEDYAREARELLRQRLIGRQVNVSMEYSRNNKVTKGSEASVKVMDYGSVFFQDDNTKTSTNIGEVLLARGYAKVVNHRDYEERSNHYDSLLAAEARARAGKKGVHSTKEYTTKHIADRTMALPKDAKAFLPFLQKKKIRAIVEHVFSGHRFKLYLPEETSYIAFSLSGVRCPAQNEPYSDEAITFMRRRMINRDVEIQVETVDKKSTYLGSLWMSNTNMAVTLVEAGLANLQAFNLDWIPDGNFLKQAEQSAKTKKLKIWENFKEVKEAVTNVPETRRRNKPEMMVMVTDILDGGRFYVRKIEDDKVSSIQEKLSSLSLGEAPEIDDRFDPKEGDIVLAQFDEEDKSWNRVMIVKDDPAKAEYEVFYIDYGNQGTVSYNNLRPLGPSVPSGPGLAQLCKLAYIKVPSLTEEFGKEAAFLLSGLTINGSNKFKAIIVEKDISSGAKGQGRGIGPVLEVILVDPSDEKINENISIGGAIDNIVIDDDNEFPEINKVEKKTKVVYPKESVPKKEGKKKYRKIDLSKESIPIKKVEKSKCFSVNASMLQSGLARLDRTRGPRSWEKKEALEKLETYEKEAKAENLGIWEYGDIPSDDEDNKDRPVVRRAAIKK